MFECVECGQGENIDAHVFVYYAFKEYWNWKIMPGPDCFRTWKFIHLL